jgi:hypothetical protein
VITEGIAVLETLAWFVPCLLAAAAASLVAAAPVGRAVGTGRMLGGLLTLSVGAILAATLTPISPSDAGLAPGVCELERIGPASLDALRSINDTSLNILLFVPLGLILGFLPARRSTVALLAAAITLPFIIEGVQLTVPVLARGCQSADVSDNLTGTIAGFAVAALVRSIGTLGGRFVPRARG